MQTYSVSSVSRGNELRADDVTGTIGKGLGKDSRTASSTPWSTERNESLPFSLSPWPPSLFLLSLFPCLYLCLCFCVCLSLSTLMIKTNPAHVAKPPKQTTMLGGCPRASGLSIHAAQGEAACRQPPVTCSAWHCGDVPSFPCQTTQLCLCWFLIHLVPELELTDILRWEDQNQSQGREQDSRRGRTSGCGRSPESQHTCL